MFINLTAIVAGHQHVYFILNLGEVICLANRRHIIWINSSLTLDLCINPLLFDQVALQKPIVEFDLSQTFQIVEPCLSEFIKDPFKELGHEVVMVHEDLKEVLDSNDLLWAQLEVTVLLASKVVVSVLIPVEIDHGLNDTEGHITNILHRYGSVIVFAPLDHRYMGAGCCRALLLLALLKQLGAIHLEQVNLLSDVINLGVDHYQSLLVGVFHTLDIDLHQ